MGEHRIAMSKFLFVCLLMLCGVTAKQSGSFWSGRARASPHAVVDIDGDGDLDISHRNIVEFRKANPRLVDNWIMPLAAIAPRSLLLWGRYFANVENEAEQPVVEAVVAAFGKDHDGVDESDVKFWATFLFTPHFPMWQAANQMDIRSADPWMNYADGVMQFAYALLFFSDVLMIIVPIMIIFSPITQALLQHEPGLTTSGALKAYCVGAAIGTLAVNILLLIACCFSYYVWWHIIPTGLVDFFFNLNLYLLLPLTLWRTMRSHYDYYVQLNKICAEFECDYGSALIIMAITAVGRISTESPEGLMLQIRGILIWNQRYSHLE